MNKKYLLIVLLMGIPLSACSPKSNTSESEPVKMSTSYKRSSASSADTKSKQFNPVINPKNVSSPGSTSLWSKEKDQELSNFMNSWQSTKKDTFVGTYDGAKPDHFGTIFPDVLVNHGSDGTFAWGNKVISMKWSPRGDQEAEYQVVAVATAVEGVTTYLFTLHNGQPVVFYTQTSNGSRMYLYDSQNFALQSGFAKIVTGNSMPEMSNSNLNNDVQARIKMKEIPLSYRHVWYYFNDQTKKVEQFDFTHRPSDMGLNYSSDHWVLIKDVEEEGIDNFKMFLRYRFFDGKQIPVAMLKDETLFNCYLDPNQIEIMHNFKYGDESN